MKIIFEFHPRTKELLETLKSKNGNAVSKQFVKEYNALMKNPNQFELSNLIDAYNNLIDVFSVCGAINIFGNQSSEKTIEQIRTDSKNGYFIYSCKPKKLNFEKMRESLSEMNYDYKAS